MTLALIRHSALSALVAATLASLLVLGSFLMFEPVVSRAQATDTFNVSQSITAEIAFIATSTDVVMAPTIAGLTGGTSNGSYTVRVNTNNSAGYNMTIAFSSTTAMSRNGGGGVINNYAAAVDGTPDYAFDDDTFAQFAYTVAASSSSELDPSFQDNGSTCGAGAGNTADTCWLDPDDTAETIINTSAATPLSGSTSTIAFRVHVPSNPSPAVPTGTYTATATLTATVN